MILCWCSASVSFGDLSCYDARLWVCWALQQADLVIVNFGFRWSAGTTNCTAGCARLCVAAQPALCAGSWDDKRSCSEQFHHLHPCDRAQNDRFSLSPYGHRPLVLWVLGSIGEYVPHRGTCAISCKAMFEGCDRQVGLPVLGSTVQLFGSYTSSRLFHVFSSFPSPCTACPSFCLFGVDGRLVWSPHGGDVAAVAVSFQLSAIAVPSTLSQRNLIKELPASVASCSNTAICLASANVPSLVSSERPPVHCLQYWTDKLWEQLASVMRTLLLLQLLAFLRLWMHAVPLMPGHQRANRCIRVTRSGLRGAPLCLLTALTLCCVQAAPKFDHIGTSGDVPLIDLLEDEVPEGRGDGPACPYSPSDEGIRVGASGSDASSRPAFFATSSQALQPSSSAVTMPVLEAEMPTPPHERQSLTPERPSGPGWRFPVQVLQFQMSSRCMSLHTSDIDTVEDFLDQVEEEMEAFPEAAQCLPVQPQPMTSFPVLLWVPRGIDLALRVPVCVQIHFLGLDVRYWMDFVEPELSFDHVKDLLHNDWVEGSKIFVGASHQALPEHVVVRPLPGDLIRVVRPGRRLSPLITLDSKLQHKSLYLRDVELEGFPDDEDSPHQYVLVQPFHAAQCLTLQPVGLFQEESMFLFGHALDDLGPVKLYWPRRQPADARVRGCAMALVAGAFPARCESRVPIFLDARFLGLPLQIYGSTGPKESCPSQLFLTT